MTPTWPSSKAKKQWKILEALLRGEMLTVAVALEKYHVYALSQECGRLRALHWPIESDTLILPHGHCSIYWMSATFRAEYRRAA